MVSMPPPASVGLRFSVPADFQVPAISASVPLSYHCVTVRDRGRYCQGCSTGDFDGAGVFKDGGTVNAAPCNSATAHPVKSVVYEFAVHKLE